jgi:hypothetical protein
MHACIARAPPTIECFLLSSYCARTERPPTFWPEAFLVAFAEEPLSASYDNHKAHHHFSRRSKLHLTGAVKTGDVAPPKTIRSTASKFQILYTLLVAPLRIRQV